MILAMDTSTYVLGTAVGSQQEIAAEWVTYLKKNHSLRLLPGIDHVMNEANVRPENLERIVVTTGPGSYTGVRIGITTAKAMASALQIPVHPISTLEALAANRRFANGLICPFIDARRGQVYAAVYEARNGKLQAIYEDRLWLMDDLLVVLQEKFNADIHFLSLDVEKHRDHIYEMLQKRAIFADGADNRVRPSEVLRVGIQAEPVSSIHALVPRYLQLAEAERKWQERQRLS